MFLAILKSTYGHNKMTLRNLIIGPLSWPLARLKKLLMMDMSSPHHR
jgi:hypothetical protein